MSSIAEESTLDNAHYFVYFIREEKYQWCGNYCIAQFESKRKQYPQCLYEKRLFIYLPKMCGGISLIGLFMVTAGLAAVYAITTFGPNLSMQNKMKAMKAKMKEMMLAHNNQIMS
ncbi:MAG: hypothetical protein ACJ72S_01650 [Nitrososphaeraceae archaeon]